MVDFTKKDRSELLLRPDRYSERLKQLCSDCPGWILDTAIMLSRACAGCNDSGTEAVVGTFKTGLPPETAGQKSSHLLHTAGS